MSTIAITRLGSLVALLLTTASLTANAQDRQPPGSAQSLVPGIERHRNPDYGAPDPKQPDTQRPAKRPEISGGYAVPFGPEQVSALPRYRASGIQFRVSPDGKWLILSHQTGEGDEGDPSLRQPPSRPGLFSGPWPYNSSFPIR